MKRTPLRRGLVRLGARARKRVKAGGKLAVGRPSDTLAGWRATVARLLERANGRCERCGVRRAPTIHHLTKRSRGGSDFDEDRLAVLDQWGCHAKVDAPFRDGRLLIAPLGAGRFCFRVVVADHKGSPETVLQHDHTPTAQWLAAQGRPTTGRGEVAGCPHGGGAT
jgi:hypothetical protein